MKLLILAAAASLALPAVALAQIPVTALTPAQQQAALKDTDPKEAANKKLAYDFWREVFVGRDMTKAEKYMAEGYIQHNPNVATGRAPFIAFFGSRGPAQPPKPAIDDLVAITADGDLVTLAFRRELPDPTKPDAKYTTTWFDMFRIENGKVAEHWDYGTKAAPAAR